MTDKAYPELPHHIGHVHSNGDYCSDSNPGIAEWPVNLYTADQMRAYVDADRASRLAAGSGISDAQIEHLCRAICAHTGVNPDQVLDYTDGKPNKWAWQRHDLQAATLLRALLAMAPATTQPAGELTGLHGYLLTQAANARDHQSAECLRDWARALPATTQAQEATHWIRVVDEELVGAHLGVADASDDYATAKKKLDQLIAWHVAVAKDSAVNGGLSLQPVAAAPTQADSGRQLPDAVEHYGAVFTDEQLAPTAPPSAPGTQHVDDIDVVDIGSRTKARGDEAQVLADAERWRTLLTMRKDLVAGIVQRHELADRYKPGPWTLQEEVDAVRAARAAMGGAKS